jgi:hypothetical protein
LECGASQQGTRDLWHLMLDTIRVTDNQSTGRTNAFLRSKGVILIFQQQHHDHQMMTVWLYPKDAPDEGYVCALE